MNPLSEIKGIRLEKLEPANLRKVGDLVYFEGPFLSLFTDMEQHLWLYDWCDRDDKCHRWMIFQVGQFHLEKYLSEEISYLEVIKQAAAEVVTIVDLDISFIPQRVWRVAKKDIPDVYLPTDKAFHDSEFCPHEAQILSFLANRKEAVAA